MLSALRVNGFHQRAQPRQPQRQPPLAAANLQHAHPAPISGGPQRPHFVLLRVHANGHRRPLYSLANRCHPRPPQLALERQPLASMACRAGLRPTATNPSSRLPGSERGPMNGWERPAPRITGATLCPPETRTIRARAFCQFCRKNHKRGKRAVPQARQRAVRGPDQNRHPGCGRAAPTGAARGPTPTVNWTAARLSCARKLP